MYIHRYDRKYKYIKRLLGHLNASMKRKRLALRQNAAGKSMRYFGCYLRTWAVGRYWPLWEPTSQGSPHLHTHLQGGSRLTFSYLSFSSFTFPGVPYRIFLVSSLASLPFLYCCQGTTRLIRQRKWKKVWNIVHQLYFIFASYII